MDGGRARFTDRSVFFRILLVRTLPIPHADEPWDLAITDDSSWALITNSAFARNTRQHDLRVSDVSVIGLADGAEIARIPAGVGSNGISLDGHGRAYVANTRSDDVTVIDVPTCASIAAVHVGAKPLGIAYSQVCDAVLVACHGDDRIWTIRAHDYTTRHTPIAAPLVRTYMEPPNDEKCGPVMRAVQVTCHPTRPEAYISDFAGDAIVVFDLLENAVVERIPVARMPYGIDVSPDGRWIAVTYDSRRYISVIDAERHAVLTTLQFARSGSILGDLLPARFRPGTSEVWITDGLNDEVAVIDVRQLVDG